MGWGGVGSGAKKKLAYLKLISKFGPLLVFFNFFPEENFLTWVGQPKSRGGGAGPI